MVTALRVCQCPRRIGSWDFTWLHVQLVPSLCCLPHRHISTWLTSTSTVPSFLRAIIRRGFLKIPPQGEKSFKSVQQTRTKERGSSTPFMVVWTPKAQGFSTWIQAVEPSQQQKASVPSPCLSTSSQWWWVLTKPCWVHQLGQNIWVTGEIKCGSSLWGRICLEQQGRGKQGVNLYCMAKCS